MHTKKTTPNCFRRLASAFSQIKPSPFETESADRRTNSNFPFFPFAIYAIQRKTSESHGIPMLWVSWLVRRRLMCSSAGIYIKYIHNFPTKSLSGSDGKSQFSCGPSSTCVLCCPNKSKSISLLVYTRSGCGHIRNMVPAAHPQTTRMAQSARGGVAHS